MAGQVRGTSDRRPADRPPDPEMAEGGRDGGRTVVRDEGRESARGGDLAAPGQSLPALRARISGWRHGGRSRRAAMSSSCAMPTTPCWGSSIGRGGATPGRTAGTPAEVRAGTAPGEDAPDRIRALCRWNGGQRGEGKPETFNFLGFTIFVGPITPTGRFTVYRKTIGKRLAAKLKAFSGRPRRRGISCQRLLCSSVIPNKMP
jgi:hypothetical protein